MTFWLWTYFLVLSSMQKTAFQNFAGGGVPIEEMFLISDVFVKNRPKWGTEMRCSE